MEPRSAHHRFNGAICWGDLGRAAMSKAYEYYARAIQCKMRAEEATDPDFKREFERLSEKWNDLAKQEETDRRKVSEASHQRPHVNAD
jgi:hypothetical protein